ncbi:MAG: tetratricopeptide repeat protein [Candidatus Melainabacteria bacterium]|nr:tetratricopeptide repeat protein [Candidatus Melainabacteria bacterium]
MAFTSKSFTLARLLVLALLCWACIQPMVSLATPTTEETATFNALKAKAESGNAQAQEDLGDVYNLGLQNIPKNKKLAYSWYEKSALQECASAQRSLGYLYYYEKDYKTAFFWFEKSAKLGNTTGQIKLGNLYEMGWGVPKDFKKALYWYEQASKQGEPYGFLYAGTFYRNGLGVTKNTKKAFEYYEKYALGGDYDFKDTVGNLYLKEVEAGDPDRFIYFSKGLYWKMYSLMNFINAYLGGKMTIYKEERRC